jgi:hypothetical protein
VLVALTLVAGALASVLPAAITTSTISAADTAATGSAGLFVPMAGRLLDTRNGTGGYATPMPANAVRTVSAAGVVGIPSSGVSAVALTLTAVGAASAGAVSVAPGDVASPTGTALVFNPGDSVSNTDLVALHADDNLHVVSNAAVNLIIDVQGYFTDGSATAPGGFVPVDQARIVDTRIGTNAPQGQVTSGSSITLTAVGLGGVPSDASAVYVNIAVLGQTTNGYLRTYAAGAPVPTSGALGFDDSTQTESVAIPLSYEGAFTVLVGAGGPVDLLVDVQGYFTPTATSGVFTPAAVHLLDTRAAPVRSIAGNGVLTLPVADVGGLPTVTGGMAALALNLRTVQPGTGLNGSGYLRVWPGDQAEPATSSLNYTTANTYRTDLAIVPPAADGTINIRNGGPQPIDVVIDAEGWFAATAPAAPTVTSSSFTDGQRGASPDASATFSFSAPPGVGNTAPVGYEYALDAADPATVNGSTVTVPLGVTTDGPHDLWVFAIDANGTQSEPADFHFEIGDDTPASSPDEAINVTITTEQMVTNQDDGTSTTQTSSESITAPDAAQPDQLSGGGGAPTSHLSCRHDFRGVFVGGILDLRYNCRFQVGNFAIRLAPPPTGATNVSPADESGFTWYLNGRKRSQTSPHMNVPISYIFHGTFKPVPTYSHAYGWDTLAYAYTLGHRLYINRVTASFDFVAVP